MTQVQINDLANLPHRDGQIVLRAARDDFEVELSTTRETMAAVTGFTPSS
jgi:hypothetical protein